MKYLYKVKKKDLFSIFFATKELEDWAQEAYDNGSRWIGVYKQLLNKDKVYNNFVTDSEYCYVTIDLTGEICICEKGENEFINFQHYEDKELLTTLDMKTLILGFMDHFERTDFKKEFGTRN